jgi:HJR/Mrr/RecB family endonuclease
MGMLFSPLSIFDRSNLEKEKKFYKGLVKSLREKIENWKNYKPIRGTIEDIFKLAKNSFSLKKFHRYTKRSVKKSVCLHVLLVGIVISLGINSKEKLKKIAEW